MLQLRYECLVSALVLSFCVFAIADPLRVANLLYRHRIAEEGNLTFALAYRFVALIGALIALYILTGDLWKLAHL